MSVKIESLNFNEAFAALGDSYADNKRAASAAQDLFEKAKKNKQLADSTNDLGKIGAAAEDYAKAENYLRGVITANAQENSLIKELLAMIGRV